MFPFLSRCSLSKVFRSGISRVFTIVVLISVHSIYMMYAGFVPASRKGPQEPDNSNPHENPNLPNPNPQDRSVPRSPSVPANRTGLQVPDNPNPPDNPNQPNPKPHYQPAPRGLLERLKKSKHSLEKKVALWKEEGRAVYPAFSVMTPDVCPPEIKHVRRVKDRLEKWKGGYLANTGLWQDIVNDKIGQIFFVHELAKEFPDAGLTYAMMYACTGEFDENFLKEFEPTNFQSSTGYVIKDLDGHSSKGVYVLPEGFGGIELLSGETMTRESITKELKAAEVTRVSIEEYIPKPATSSSTVDYKFLMFGENIFTIAVIHNRGQPSQCFSYFDVEWNRLDNFGCFYDDGGPEAPGSKNAATAQPHKICSDVPRPEILLQLIKAATVFGKNLGVFYRVDMFIHPKTKSVVLGEFTPWPSAGNHDCRATNDSIVGFDACAHGRAWLTETTIGIRKGYTGRVYEGGVGAIKPGWVDGFRSMNFSERCSRAVEFSRLSGHGMKNKR